MSANIETEVRLYVDSDNNICCFGDTIGYCGDKETQPFIELLNSIDGRWEVNGARHQANRYYVQIHYDEKVLSFGFIATTNTLECKIYNDDSDSDSICDELDFNYDQSGLNMVREFIIENGFKLRK